MRVSSLLRWLLPALALTAWTGCAALSPAAGSSATAEGSAPVEAAAKADDDATKAEALAKKIDVAQRRMKHAEMERAMFTADSRTSIAVAAKELAFAEARLVQYKELDMPNRMARSELGLQRARDGVQEAADELKQIELMYAEQNLEDMTAEFVINRGKRNAERAQHSLAIQEREHTSLVSHELPRELAGMELDVMRKKSALEQAKAGAEAGMLMKEIARLNLETELADLERERAELEEGAEAK